jgi:hypothetical protein
MATIDLGKIKLKWQGTYAGGTAYVPDDVVYYVDGTVGSSYMCIANTTGNAPSSGGTLHASWEYLAKGQAISPTTTQGDLIVRGASADERLAIGAAGKALKVNSSANGLEYGDAGSWTVIASGSGPSTPAASLNIDNIFSSTYQVYKVWIFWAQADWVKSRYIKADGTVESGNVYLWSGKYTSENSGGGPSRYGGTNTNYATYNYWHGASDCPSMVEVTYYDPFNANFETNDMYTGMSVTGTQMVSFSGCNGNMNAYSVRGIKLFSNSGGSNMGTNLKYLVLGAKLP